MLDPLSVNVAPDSKRTSTTTGAAELLLEIPPENVVEPYPRKFSVRVVVPLCRLRKLPTVSNAPLSIELFRVQSPLMAPASAVPPAAEVPVSVIGLAPPKSPVLPPPMVTSVPKVNGPPYPKIPPPLLAKVRPPGPTPLGFNPNIP